MNNSVFEEVGERLIASETDSDQRN